MEGALRNVIIKQRKHKVSLGGKSYGSLTNKKTDRTAKYCWKAYWRIMRINT